MDKYLVVFSGKEFNKKYQILSQDKATATKWSEIQLAHSKVTSKVRTTVTKVIA